MMKGAYYIKNVYEFGLITYPAYREDLLVGADNRLKRILAKQFH